MPKTHPTRTFLIILACNAVLLLMTKLFFIDIIMVRGRSMEPSLGEGTPVVVNKTAYGLSNPFSGGFLLRWRDPARGDIVIFKSPLDGETTLKRCVAVAGDELSVEDGELAVNGLRIPLRFFQGGRLAAAARVPAGNILVLGDNYEASSDSRTFGFVPSVDVSAAVLCPPAAPGKAP